MVAVRCSTRVQCTSREDTDEALVLFDLESIGIDTATFLRDLLPTFELLEWDVYDVRREQLAMLQKALTVPADAAASFYVGETSFFELTEALPPLPTELLDRLQLVTPYRRRSTAHIYLERSEPVWCRTVLSNDPISQHVASTDYRSIPRRFRNTAPGVIEHPQFERLVDAVAGMVLEADPNVHAIDLTCWQTAVVATAQRAGTNSPEGIHQDGADYIVSALVLERTNVEGGESRVFAADKKTEHLHVELQPGQGIFQADAGSSLWHDVTPIRTADPSKGAGARKSFGFDIRVVERR